VLHCGYTAVEGLPDDESCFVERAGMLRGCVTLAVLAMSGVTQVASPIFEERDGRVVMEVESHPPMRGWAPEREMEGYTGAGYYTWRAGNSYKNGGNGVLTYVFDIKTAGKYHLRIRNRHDFHDSTLQNDVFTRLDGGKWVKTFSSKRGEWTFRSNHEHGHNSKPPASYELKEGRHVMQISGRSEGFSIDRIHLYRDGNRGAEDASLEETRVGGSSQGKPAEGGNADGGTRKQPTRVVSGAPNLSTRMNLAKRYLAKGDKARAAAILTALVERYPDSPEAKEAAELLRQAN
jgi:hypothetical protein